MTNFAKPLSERDERILNRYTSGATLEEIGAAEDLTRERIRQIVKRHGGPGAETARAARHATKEAQAKLQRDEFLSAYGTLAKELAHNGFSRRLTVSRISTFFPHINRDVAEEALKLSGIVFDQENGADFFSNAALEAGVWYLLASEEGLKPDHYWAAVNLPQPLLEELSGHLMQADVSSNELATIFGMIGAAERLAREKPGLTITGSRYNELRAELLEAMGLVSAKGATPWPPTRQTIMKRYSGWNDALESMGLATASKGRPKGLLHFVEEDYAQAVAEFIEAQVNSGRTVTYADYGHWVSAEAAAGTRRPSPSSARNFFGSWMNALRVAKSLSPRSEGETADARAGGALFRSPTDDDLVLEVELLFPLDASQTPSVTSGALRDSDLRLETDEVDAPARLLPEGADSLDVENRAFLAGSDGEYEHERSTQADAEVGFEFAPGLNVSKVVWSPEDDERLLRAYLSQREVAAAAEMLGIDSRVVALRLVELLMEPTGIIDDPAPARFGERYTQEETQLIVDDWGIGRRLPAIARRHDRSQLGVGWKLLDHPSAPVELDEAMINEIVDMADQE